MIVCAWSTAMEFGCCTMRNTRRSRRATTSPPRQRSSSANSWSRRFYLTYCFAFLLTALVIPNSFSFNILLCDIHIEMNLSVSAWLRAVQDRLLHTVQWPADCASVLHDARPQPSRMHFLILPSVCSVVLCIQLTLINDHKSEIGIPYLKQFSILGA